MGYKILRIDDRATTATVEMTIQGRVLVQDFPLGKDPKELKASITEGMKVFKAEHDARESESKDIGEYNFLIDKPINVIIKGEKL